MTKDTDPDLRFMALNDLEKEMSNTINHIASYEVDEYARILLTRLNDEFPEVRTQSLKCFESLPYRLKVDILPVVRTLINKKPKKVSITSTIYTMALHNILENLPLIEEVHVGIINIVLPEIFSDREKFKLEIDYIEILTDLIEYSGKYFNQTQIFQTLGFLTEVIFTADAIISKKSISAYGSLSKNIESIEIIENFLKNITQLTNSYKNFYEGQSKLLSVISVSFASNSLSFEPFALQLWEIISSCLKVNELGDLDQDYENQQEKDNLRVEALTAALSLFKNCKSDNTYFLTGDCLDICEVLIKYDPYGDNSEDDEESNALADDIKDYNDFEDEDGDSYSDYEDDEDADDDNCSWKVRLEALNVLSCVIENFPQRLPLALKKCFNDIMILLDIEKNKNVLLRLCETLSFIFELSSPDGAYYNLLNSKNMAETTNGRRLSDVSMACDDDPYALFVGSAENINEKILKLIRSNEAVVNDKPEAFLKLVSNITRTLGGVGSHYVESYIVALNQSWNSIPYTVQTHYFYSAFLENDKIDSFGDGLPYFVNFLKNCLSNRSNQKMVLEGMSLINEIFETQCLGDGDYNSTIRNNDIVTQLSYLLVGFLLGKLTDRNLSSEMRLQALNSLTSMCLKAQLDKETVKSILNALTETLSTEVLAFNTLNAIKKFCSSGKINFAISPEWIKAILGYILQYFKISELSGTCVKTVSIITSSGFFDEADGKSILLAIGTLFSNKMFTPLNCVDIGITLTNILDKVNITSDMTTFISVLIELSKFDEFDEVLPDLMEKILLQTTDSSLSQAIQSFDDISDIKVSKLLAVLMVTSKNYTSIDNIIQNIQSGNDVYFSLVFLNQVLKSVDLKTELGLFLNGYSSNESNVVNMTMKTVSTIVCKYPDNYLPQFMVFLKGNASTPAFKTLANILDHVHLSHESASHLFKLIIDVQRSSPQLDNTTEYSNAADCLGALAFKYNLLPGLLDVLSATKSSHLTLLITLGDTVKYTFGNTQFLENAELSQLVKYSEMTTNNFIFHSNLLIKEVGAFNLNLILSKKVNIAISLMNKIVPNIVETEIKPNKSFIRVQMIGPYKYKIDDGLNFRKQIFESIYNLFKVLEDNRGLEFLCDIEWRLLFTKYFDCGIKDDQTISSVTLLTTLKIFEHQPEIFVHNFGDVQIFESFLERCRKVLNKKIADNAVKQDIEKQTNLVKSLIRFLKRTERLVESNHLLLSGSQLSAWKALISETKAKFLIYKTEEVD